MNKYSCLLPSFSSWMNAIFLFLLLRLFLVILKLILPLLKPAFYNPPESSLFVICLLCWSPLLFIAFSHHFIHLTIAKIYPNIQVQELDKTEGLFPGVISWWEGLYGWLVIIVSLLIGATIISFYLLYAEPINQWQNIESIPTSLVEWSSLFILVASAYLYHFENIVKKRLVSIKKSKVK